VQLTLEATAFVRRGESIFLKARAKHARWFGSPKNFYFSSDGGSILPAGSDGSRAYIETHDLAPGEYLVKVHFEQGLDQADASASFVVLQ
jgi:hypothetical protein